MGSPGSSDAGALLSIGQLAERTGVAATALRSYDELGLVRPATRASGRRRYHESAAMEVGVIRFLRAVGFSLAEITSLVVGPRGSWKDVVGRKLAELETQQHRLDVARTALEHALRCPTGEPVACPRFQSIIRVQQEGLSLEESHSASH